MLFFAPDIHLKSLKHIWVDGVIVENAWKKFIEKVQEEWEQFLLPVSYLNISNKCRFTNQMIVPGYSASIC
jgi:hypothetical protein